MRVASLSLLVLALLPAAAGARADWLVTGRSDAGAAGSVAFRVNNEGDWIYSYRFHFVTRCGTVAIPGRLPWSHSSSSFRYASRDGRVRMYTYAFTGPDGGGYGWVSDTRANGCRSGRVSFHL